MAFSLRKKSTRSDATARETSRKSKRRFFQQAKSSRTLLIEQLEGRALLAADCLGEISGTIFTDLTENGLTADDVRLSGVTMTLYEDTNANGVFDSGTDTVAATTNTDANGFYEFEGLQVGTFFVEQAAQAGLLQRGTQTIQTVQVTQADGVLGDSIDTFNDTAQSVNATFGVNASDASAIAVTEALGGERDLFVEPSAGEVGLRADHAAAMDVLEFTSSSNGTGRRIVTWDGADGDAMNLAATGLGGFDFTNNGSNTGLSFTIGASDAGGVMRIVASTDATNSSVATFNIPDTGGLATERIIVLFSDFATNSGTGADFSSIGALQIEIESSGVMAVDGQLDQISLIGPDVFTTNFANLNPLSLGDSVWRDTNNNGTLDGGEGGIDGVALTLFTDTDGNGVLTTGTDVQVATTTTSGGGSYSFGNLFPGDYIVRVNDTNFSGALSGLVSSQGNAAATDPDTNVDGDDNGAPLTGQGVVASAITLSAGGESGDGDANANNNPSLDFGFAGIDLQITKTDSPDPVLIGNQLTYTLDITNNGPANATGVTVTDTLPAGVTFVSATPSQGTANEAGGVITADLANLNSGQSASIIVVVSVDAGTTGPIVNVASVTANESGPNNVNEVDSTNNQAQASTNVTQIDLAITKSDSPDPVLVGGQLTYTLNVTNNGPADATGVTVTDTLPAGVTSASVTPGQGTASEANGVVTASLGNLNSGDSTSITVVVDVAPGTTGTITNTASVTSNESGANNVNETNTTNNQDQVTTTVTPIDVAITKTDSPDPVLVGGQLTYTLNVTNNGPADVTGVTVTDTLPAGVTLVSATPSQGTASEVNGVITANLGAINNGDAATITVVVTVDPGTTGTITNTASVTTAESGTNNVNETNTANNQAQVTTTITPIDVAITKSDSPDPVLVGGQLTYTLNVANNGPANVTGVTVTDTLPAGVTLISATPSQGTASEVNGVITANLGAMNNGDTATINIVVVVDPGTTGTITNVASVTTDQSGANNINETNTANNQAQVTTTITPIDVAITKNDSPDPVLIGDQLTYTLNVFNNGLANVTGVTVTDALPTGVTFVSATSNRGTASEANGVVTANLGSMNTGDTATITVVVTIDQGTTGTITNTASVTADQSGANNVNETNTANNQAQVTTTIQPIDVAITKSASANTVLVGDQLTYTLDITNNTQANLTGVTVTDTLPTGVSFVSIAPSQGTASENNGVITADLGSLNGSGTASIDVVVTVDPSAAGQITNVATVTTDQSGTNNTNETNTANNQAQVTTTVNPLVDLAIAKIDSVDPVDVGTSLSYTLTITNNGPSTATGVTVTDNLPGELTFSSASASQGTASAANGVVTTNIGSLASGQSATVTIVTQVSPTALGTITNTASVSTNETETTTTNNTASETTTVNSSPNSSISGTVYVDLNNNGTQDANEVAIPGVTIELTGTTASGPVNLMTTTDNNGNFRFDNLRAGTYQLTETQPAMFLDGVETSGSTGSDTSQDDVQSQIQLGNNTNATDFLFGERPLFFSKRLFTSSGNRP